MKQTKLALWLVTITCAALSIMPAPAVAKYPEKPIVIIVSGEPGSPTDILIRGVVQMGEKYVGQPMSVLTKSGGGGTAAMAHLLRQRPDGYTLMAGTISFCTVMALGRGAPMKEKDFTPVCQLQVETPILCVNGERPYNTWQKFVDYAKENPNTIKVSNPGSGENHHTTWLRIKKIAGIQALDIPYDGGRLAATSAMGGHDDATINNPSVIKTGIETGKLRGIFVTGEKRLDFLPDTPTLKELGINIVRYQWRGLMAKAGVPKDNIDYLAQAFKKMTEDPEWILFLKKFSWESVYVGPDDLKKVISDEINDTRELLIEEGLLKKE
jgi:tripartite-type tricarboxylate transporter receptor subunit TctC